MSTISFAPYADRTVRSVRPAGAARSARPARPAQRGGQVRLTRRGRLVVLALAFVVVAMVAVWWSAGSAATREEGAAPAVEVVTVAPGDTLWGIASDVAASTGDDVRSVMERIEQLNVLESSVVYAGQELRVPMG